MEELDLKELLNMFWSKKLSILIIVTIFAVIGFVYTMTMVEPEYESSTRLVLAKTSDNGNTIAADLTSITQSEITMNQKLVSTYRELIGTKAVLRQVLDNLQIKDMSEEALKKSITVSSVKDTELIEITVKNQNPSYSEKLANEIAIVFSEQVKQIYNISNVYVVDKAEIATEPCNVNHMKDIVIFMFVGIVISVAYVLIANMLDTTVKSAEDIERNTKLTVLAQIPENNFEGRSGGRRR